MAVIEDVVLDGLSRLVPEIEGYKLSAFEGSKENRDVSVRTFVTGDFIHAGSLQNRMIQIIIKDDLGNAQKANDLADVILKRTDVLIDRVSIWEAYVKSGPIYLEPIGDREKSVSLAINVSLLVKI